MKPSMKPVNVDPPLSQRAHALRPIESSTCIYYQRGGCRYGEQCKYSHPSPSIGPTTGTPVKSTKADALGSDSSPFGPCIFFSQGRCSKGEACSFPHAGQGATTRTDSRYRPIYTSPSGHLLQDRIASKSTTDIQTAPTPCKYFMRGICAKGDTCSFPHPTGTAPMAVSSAAPRSAEGCAKAPRPPAQAQGSSKDTLDHIQPEASHVEDELANEPQVVTRTKLGCKIIHGPGAAIQSVTTAFQSTCVLLHNLPRALTQTDLIALAERFGALKSVVINVAHDATSCPSARLEYLDTDSAANAAQAITQESLLRRATARLDLRAAESGAAVLRSTKVKITWFAPSITAWAHYDTLSKARAEASRLDKTTIEGQIIRASFQQPSYRQRTSFSVEMKGLPLSTPLEHLKRFCRTSSVTKGCPSFDIDDSAEQLRTLLSRHGPLESFDFAKGGSNRRSGTSGAPKLNAFAQFCEADAAERAVSALHGTHQAFLRGSQVFLELIHSVKYMLPRAQFNAIRSEIERLSDGQQACKLRFHDKDEHGGPIERVCIRAYGPNAKALSRLKTELEGVLKGEIVRDDGGQVVWHENFPQSSGKAFLDALAADTQAFVRCDDRTRTIHLFGSAAGRATARTRIVAKVQEMSANEHIIEMDDPVFRRMLHGGLQQLQAAFAGTSFHLHVVRRDLVIHGEPSDVRAVRAMLLQSQCEQITTRSSGDDTPCPICFCDVSDPLSLPCGHTYCRPCLKHYLLSIAQTTGGAASASAICLAETTSSDDGEAASCGKGLPLSTVRALLSPEEEERLFEATFLSYIHGRPQEFKYCPTADCQTIYRAAPENTLLRCPSCLARICASCHVESHEGLSCAEYKDYASGGNESFLRWREEHGVKPCPGCGAHLEKSGGCNHMSCARCGTHMCWVCMKVFKEIDSGQGVYAHMRREHGGIGV
ncbi:hypothetical protein ONZ51_g2450 [Trametes cubensis]|uniref:RING-type E3 ubiquitin transferase n=1 Tax=Trametes cubensis TaxID=1111947 RepID=A0AAD7TZM6_9APHY|nr:hypothetical protein ONZ51_g2450 [Trametes cubensis]